MECFLRVYLSLIGKAVRADDAFVELDRGLRVARFVFVPEVHVVEAEPLGESFIPLKVVQERPRGVALHVDSVFNRCDRKTQRTNTFLSVSRVKSEAESNVVEQSFFSPLSISLM